MPRGRAPELGELQVFSAWPVVSTAAGQWFTIPVNGPPGVSTAVSVAGPVCGVWYWRCEPISSLGDGRSTPDLSR
jgi:hypothetical protein